MDRIRVYLCIFVLYQACIACLHLYCELGFKYMYVSDTPPHMIIITLVHRRAMRASTHTGLWPLDLTLTLTCHMTEQLASNEY